MKVTAWGRLFNKYQMASIAARPSIISFLNGREARKARPVCMTAVTFSARIARHFCGGTGAMACRNARRRIMSWAAPGYARVVMADGIKRETNVASPAQPSAMLPARHALVSCLRCSVNSKYYILNFVITAAAREIYIIVISRAPQYSSILPGQGGE